MRILLTAIALSVICALLAIGSAKGNIWIPSQNMTWQWQITGYIDTTVNAQMFDIDLFDASPGGPNETTIATLHSQGRWVVCYMDSGAWESYRPDAGEFPTSVIGNSTGWDGEYWLDIRQSAWSQFEPIIVARMQLAKDDGCDGIEPDQNNPVGNNPGFPITLADEKAWYLEVAADAHALGLTVFMKNGIELLPDSQLVTAFDGDINEECNQYKECEPGLGAFVSAHKWVGEVEYQGDPTVFCPKLQANGFMAMKKHLALGVWRTPCW